VAGDVNPFLIGGVWGVFASPRCSFPTGYGGFAAITSGKKRIWRVIDPPNLLIGCATFWRVLE
jgi:hypothetical protein